MSAVVYAVSVQFTANVFWAADVGNWMPPGCSGTLSLSSKCIKRMTTIGRISVLCYCSVLCKTVPMI